MRATAIRAIARPVLALTTALVAAGCGGGKSPAPPPPSAPGPGVPGATIVTGQERLAWSQGGDLWRLSFRAWVDDTPVDLEGVSCGPGNPEPECTAALPAMADGVHTIQVAAVYVETGAESERSGTITVQKVSARTAQSASALPDAGAGRVVLPAPEGALLSMAGVVADVVARDVRMPAQLGALPDGRLLVADAGGRVRLVYPDAPARQAEALDAATLLTPPPSGGLAVAVSPEFASNRHVFIADTYRDGEHGLRTRIVRLREVGDRLGEPATLFDAAVSPSGGAAGGAPGAAALDAAAVEADVPVDGGPRLAFSPEGMLHALLPPGLIFDGQPAASAPVAAVARITPDGRTPGDGGLEGVTRHPLAVAWHPATRQLLGLMPDGPSRALVRPLGGGRGGADAAIARFRSDDDGAGRLLRFDTLMADGVLDLVHLAAGASAGLPPAVVRLSVPADLDGIVPGLRGRLTDLVSRDGVAYAVVSGDSAGAGRPDTTGTVIRLRRP